MTIGEKGFKFLRALAREKSQIKHDLPLLLSQILCSSLV